MPISHPRKQTVAILVVCLVAVTIAAAYAYSQNPQNQGSVNESGSVSTGIYTAPANTIALSTSTDWRNQFFGTNPIAGSPSLTATSTQNGSPEKLTATEQFSRDAFTQFMNLKQAGLASDNEVVSSTVMSLLSKDYSASDKPQVYTMSDIVVGSSDSTAALKAYGNAIGALLLKYSPTQDSATIALAGMQGKDTNYTTELSNNAAAYQLILKRLLAIATPPSLETYHLGLVNGASNMIYVTSALSVSETDPMRAINGLGQYQTAFTGTLDALVSIRKALADAGITYISSDGGSFFKI